MNYEKIILDMQTRIMELEEKVEKLMEERSSCSCGCENGKEQEECGCHCLHHEVKISMTQRIRNFINEAKEQAAESGKKELVLNCNDIQKIFGITNRTPQVCAAMYDCMEKGDEVLSSPPSGKSTTVTVKYYL